MSGLKSLKNTHGKSTSTRGIFLTTPEFSNTAHRFSQTTLEKMAAAHGSSGSGRGSFRSAPGKTREGHYVYKELIFNTI